MVPVTNRFSTAALNGMAATAAMGMRMYRNRVKSVQRKAFVKRMRVEVTPQAFVTLNDPVYVEASQALGRRLVAVLDSTP